MLDNPTMPKPISRVDAIKFIVLDDRKTGRRRRADYLKVHRALELGLDLTEESIIQIEIFLEYRDLGGKLHDAYEKHLTRGV
jgi:hypothetical protein